MEYKFAINKYGDIVILSPNNEEKTMEDVLIEQYKEENKKLRKNLRKVKRKNKRLKQKLDYVDQFFNANTEFLD